MEKTSEDIAIIHKVKGGDKSALYILYDRYSAALYGVIIRICKKEDIAQDLLQETFLKIWKKIDQYDSQKGKFYTWAYQIAKNTALNEARKRKKLIQTEDLSVYEDEQQDEGKPDFSTLNGAIKNLDDHHQRAITLLYFNGLTHREAHEEMGVPLGTFKSYVRQALTKLRKEYTKEFLLLALFLETIANG